MPNPMPNHKGHRIEPAGGGFDSMARCQQSDRKLIADKASYNRASGCTRPEDCQEVEMNPESSIGTCQMSVVGLASKKNPKFDFADGGDGLF